MTPAEKEELARLRQCTGSLEDFVRLDELEARRTRDGGVLGLLRSVADRASTWLTQRVVPAVTPSAHWRRDTEALDVVEVPEPMGPDESPLEEAVRIRREYVDAVSNFQKQRAGWKDMFHESWPHHLAAQFMLERMLEEGRAQLVLLAEIARRELGVRVLLSAAQAPGAEPLGVAATYEHTMKLVEELSGGETTDVEAKLASIQTIAQAHDGRPVPSELDDVLAENKRLHALIRTIERERDAWKERKFGEQALHNGSQARLENALASVSESHARLLSAVNAKRAADNDAPLRTREDLKAAAGA